MSFPCNCSSSLDPSNEQKVVLDKYSQETVSCGAGFPETLVHARTWTVKVNLIAEFILLIPLLSEMRFFICVFCKWSEENIRYEKDV